MVELAVWILVLSVGIPLALMLVIALFYVFFMLPLEMLMELMRGGLGFWTPRRTQRAARHSQSAPAYSPTARPDRWSTPPETFSDLWD